MSKTLVVNYNLNPPVETVTPESHPTSKTHEFSVPTSASGSQQEYYLTLRDVVMQAKARIGADLTVWRDAVGTLENSKEPKRGQKEDEEEEEDEEQA